MPDLLPPAGVAIPAAGPAFPQVAAQPHPSPSPEEPPTPVPLATRVCTLAGVLLPLLGFAAGVVLLWGWGFSWVHLGLLVGMYLLTGLGITVGYHRLFTHRSFQTTRAVQFVLAVLGSMAAQGPLLTWVATHRRHHRHSDRGGDPHSPHGHGRSLRGVLRGLWHAHLGWVLGSNGAAGGCHVPDLSRSAMLRRVSMLFPLWVALGLLIPAAVAGLLTLSWWGALLGLLWGGGARMFLVHHVTWSVNSVCHLWGRRPFRSKDQSRNNVVFGVLALGEGWHNTHHAFPTSARHGLRWWQLDASYYVIRVLAWLRLAWNVRLPSERAIASQRA
jgi:stearoyl-CoA desaturase (delta-9 desaturase)